MGSGSRGLAAEWAALTAPGPSVVWGMVLGAAGGLLLAPQLLISMWRETALPRNTTQILGNIEGFVDVGLDTSPPVLSLVLVMAAMALFGASTVWLVLVDVRERRLPHPVITLATGGLVMPLAVTAIVWGSATRLGWSLAATAALTALTLLAWWCAPAAIGGGDVKLMPATAFLAAFAHPVAGSVGFVLLVCGALAVTGAVALARRRASVPLGPILLGASWAVAVGANIIGSMT